MALTIITIHYHHLSLSSIPKTDVKDMLFSIYAQILDPHVSAFVIFIRYTLTFFLCYYDCCIKTQTSKDQRLKSNRQIKSTIKGAFDV